ncbi:PIN domain-containing protein [Candidatus Woesearchaeota archaeon]|nr:PIN domain-containing protein [Candidatus Woesearchaeota archaeon]
MKNSTSVSEKRYLFDTYAIIEIIKINKNYERFKDEVLLTSILNFGELYYYFLKENRDIPNLIVEKIKKLLLTIDLEDITEAMKFRYIHREKKFSFVDSVGYIIALRRGMIFVTGDKEFKDMKNVEFVK